MIQVVGLITARGGSKDIPNKNVKTLAGRPLIAWTIEAALRSNGINRVIVTTDDYEIARVAREWGAEVPFMRPSELAQDDSPHVPVVEHSARWLEQHNNSLPDYIMVLQPTSPLRTAEDIDAAIRIAEVNNAAAVASVCETRHHPYLTKYILKGQTLADFVPNDLAYLRRQDLPRAYWVNGAGYLIRCKTLLDDHTLMPTNTYSHIMPPERSLDINSEWDFHLAELILNYNCTSTTDGL